MEKKINERKEMKEVYKCDYVHICDNCAREREKEYKLKLLTPETLYKKDNPEFCSIKCMREWILDSEKPKLVEDDPIIRDEEFDRYEGGKTYSIMDLTLDNLRILLIGEKKC
jgi:hypothetical protein